MITPHTRGRRVEVKGRVLQAVVGELQAEAGHVRRRRRLAHTCNFVGFTFLQRLQIAEPVLGTGSVVPNSEPAPDMEPLY